MMKKLYYFFLLLPFLGTGVSSVAQGYIQIAPAGTTYTGTPAVKFRVSWSSIPQDGKTRSSKIWVLVDYRKIENQQAAGSWTRATVAGVSPGTVDAGGKGFWLQGNAGAYNEEVTVTLRNMPAHFKWCAYALDCPPQAIMNAAGGYDLRGTPPFTVNNTTLAAAVNTFSGECITTFTDATGNPAWVPPAAPAVKVPGSVISCNNAAATLSCTVSGGTTTAMTYTWHVNGATSVTAAPALTIPNLTASVTYTVTAMNANRCSSTVSNTGTVTIGGLTQHDPSPATVCYNTAATLAPGAAGGGLGGITYLWRESPDASSWSDAPGANTNADYTTAALTSTMYYRRIAADAVCGAATSSIATVTVYPEFSAGSIITAGTITIPNGKPAAIATSAIDASGGDGNITYEWRRDGTPLPNSGSAGYAIGSLPANYSTRGEYAFTRYAKDATCNTFTASAGQFTLTVSATPPPNTGTTVYTCGKQIWSGPVKIAACRNSKYTEDNSTPQCTSSTANQIDYYYYNWVYAYNNRTNMCPAPWRVPTDNDFEDLTTCLGTSKIKDVYYPETSQWGGTLGGLFKDGRVQAVNTGGYYWSSQQYGSGVNAYYLKFDSGEVKILPNAKSMGFQVRCVL
jgi:uncharacterized protein (TIGR02145 family)